MPYRFGRVHVHIEDDFEEKKHPRVKSGPHAGEFGKGSGVSKKESKEERFKRLVAEFVANTKNPTESPKISEQPKAVVESAHKPYDGPNASSSGLAEKGDILVNKKIAELERKGDDDPEFKLTLQAGTVVE
jgi:hypothetical protein